MGDATAAAYDPIYRALYPGDDAVDFVGLDIYNTGPNLDWGAPRWRSFGQVLREPYAALTAVSGKPIILAEVGSTEVGGSKSDWIADALSSATAAEFPRVQALVWFDVNKEQTWQIASTAPSLDAWGAAARSALFGANPLALLG
jgi:endoglucanase